MTRRRPPMTLTTLEDRWTPAAAGTLDPTFGVGGKQTYPAATVPAGDVAVSVGAWSLVTKPDGKLVLIGDDGRAGLTALGINRDGSRDATFGQAGVASLDFGDAIQYSYEAVAQPDGRIVLLSTPIVGVSLEDFALARITPAGALDPTFGSGGKVSYGDGKQVSSGIPGENTMALQPDGKIVVAGRRNDPTTQIDTIRVLRFLANGGLDTSFGVSGAAQLQVGKYSSASGVAILADGRIVVSGSFGTSRDLYAVRLKPDGSSDPTFGTNAQATVDFGESESGGALALQRDGKLVLTGVINRVSQPGQPVVTAFATRLDAAGKIDATFGNNGQVLLDNGTSLSPSGAEVQQNGKLIVSLTPPPTIPVQKNPSFVTVRLNADGTLDRGYGNNGLAEVGFDGDTRVSVVAVQPDGAVVVAGTSGGEGTGRFPVIVGGFFTRTFAVARLIRDALPVPPGSVFVGGSPDGGARLLAPSPSGLQANPALNVYPGFAGSVRTAVADVNGDGVPDYITGPGAGGGPNVVVTDGNTGAKIADFNAFETTFTGGVFVAAADLNGDGKADIFVTPDQGGGPVVAIFDGASLSAGKGAASELTRFFGIDDTAFRGGARPALGDVNGDGRPDLVVAAGFGGGPRVALFNGKSVLTPPAPGKQPLKLVGDFFVFEPTLRNGVFVAAGDLSGDGKAEVVVGGGPGGGPRVMAISGASLLGGQMTPVANFFAGDAASRGGVRVAVRPAADGTAQIVTGSGEGQPGRVNVYKAATAIAGGPADQVVSPFGDTALVDGVFVG